MRPIVNSVARLVDCAPKYRAGLLYVTKWLCELSGQEAVDNYGGVGQRFNFHQVDPMRTYSSAYSDHAMHIMPEGNVVYRAQLWNLLLRQCDAIVNPVGNGFVLIASGEALHRRYMPQVVPHPDGTGIEMPCSTHASFEDHLPEHWTKPERVPSDRAEIHVLAADAVFVECLGITYHCPDLDAAFLLWLALIWNSSLRGLLRVPIKNGARVTSYNEVSIAGALETLVTEMCGRAWSAYHITGNARRGAG